MKNLIPRRVFVTLFLALLFSASAFAQQEPAPKPSPENVARAEAILSRAVEVLGGAAYLNVKTMVSRGFYTSFRDGVSQDPARFVDYISYPDRERTEFTGSGIRTIQTNTGETGWLFDGATRTLSDMKGAQISSFKQSMRTSLENVLRGWWKKESASLSYVGRREAGLGRRNETVRISYPDGFWVEYEFAAREGLPEKILFKTTRSKAEVAETEDVKEEDRLAKPISIAGVTSPWVIDHFINGVQTSRIAYESVEYNTPIADALFVKPATVKGLK
jgi:hypothetical protein